MQTLSWQVVVQAEFPEMVWSLMPVYCQLLLVLFDLQLEDLEKQIIKQERMPIRVAASVFSYWYLTGTVCEQQATCWKQIVLAQCECHLERVSQTEGHEHVFSIQCCIAI